ncbi:MAG TPA: hypothetical protein VII06_26825 [Chloroflexota bacterium]|jgi:hypothetical protein
MLDEQAVREYFENSTWRLNQLQSRAVWEGSDDWARAERATLDGLLRLNRLPRSDPYWATWANDLPTFAKLGEYAARLRDADSSDIGAIWLAAAGSLYACDNDFGSDAWRALHRQDEFDIAWAIDAAAVVELSSGVPTVEAVGSLIRELGQADAAGSYLSDHLKSENAYAASWARRALEALKGEVAR